MAQFTPDEIMQAMMANLRMWFEHDVSGAIDPDRQKKSDHFVVWAVPGIPVQPEDLAFIDELAAGFPDPATLPDDGKDISTVPASEAPSLRPKQ